MDSQVAIKFENSVIWNIILKFTRPPKSVKCGSSIWDCDVTIHMKGAPRGPEQLRFRKRAKARASLSSIRADQRPRQAVLNTAKAPAVAIDKTLTKGLLLLEALSGSEGSRGISDLAQDLSLTKSNVHRLLQTLIRCGYITKEQSTERYLLSSKLWRISHGSRPIEALRRLVRPVLRTLVQEVSESVGFFSFESDELVHIDQVETNSLVRVFFDVGRSFRIDQILLTGNGLTALQTVALASLPDSEARRTVQSVQKQLRESASYVEQQMSAIKDVRKKGFALCLGGWVPDVSAIAVPVMAPSKQLIGVLTCFGPIERFTESTRMRIKATLQAKSKDLSRQICE